MTEIEKESVTVLKKLRDAYYKCKPDSEMKDAARLIVASALDVAIEALERDRWISVDERMPEPTWDRVLVYTDERQVMTIPACKVGNGYVTHWKAVEPPKEGKQ